VEPADGSRRQEVAQQAAPRYKHGDYLRVDLLARASDAPISVWICVDHCDERHAIVFGTVDSEPPQCLGNMLRRGACCLRPIARYGSIVQHCNFIVGFERISSRKSASLSDWGSNHSRR
jgi:hypothetical protein